MIQRDAESPRSDPTQEDPNDDCQIEELQTELISPNIKKMRMVQNIRMDRRTIIHRYQFINENNQAIDVGPFEFLDEYRENSVWKRIFDFRGRFENGYLRKGNQSLKIYAANIKGTSKYFKLKQPEEFNYLNIDKIEEHQQLKKFLAPYNLAGTAQWQQETKD